MLDCVWSYVLCREQDNEVQVEEGTHKLELPVSNTTWKFCAGVPMEIAP